eukprot:CAMPEP_0178794664 /NCGR_PEP_ID=MMETSP0745-20121128/9706_1 /TAXON_ID=913974 /ORGANISM="Nitzschia punctata, Strain CCMP561" /LENGTH=138 /DNA_ID=CAMNT_0020452991 /DNA_START=75 /DNA_END=489 /DNA_ORIENTATION=-
MSWFCSTLTPFFLLLYASKDSVYDLTDYVHPSPPGNSVIAMACEWADTFADNLVFRDIFPFSENISLLETTPFPVISSTGGTDGTEDYVSMHPRDLLRTVEKFKVGSLESSPAAAQSLTRVAIFLYMVAFFCYVYHQY